jgi:hypothetical protein
VKSYIIFSVTWALGGSLHESSRKEFHDMLFKLLRGEDVKLEYKLIDLPIEWEPVEIGHKLPSEENIFDWVFAKKKDYFEWTMWEQLLTEAY